MHSEGLTKTDAVTVATGLLRALDAGSPVCVTVTLVHALVLARSQFHTSMNYRSVVIVGTASRISTSKRRDRRWAASWTRWCRGAPTRHAALGHAVLAALIGSPKGPAPLVTSTARW